MKRILLYTLVIALLVLVSNCLIAQSGNMDHALWDQLLNKHVDAQGMVDYRGLLEEKPILDQYLDLLSANTPGENQGEKEKLSYWINAYNAFTVSLILEHYPIKSIMDINNAWDNKFILLDEKKYSLNQIEHKIIRKEFEEPRIHFALVCAAISCPVLLNEAYDPKKLNEQLQLQGERFINDAGKNKISEESILISQIFNWFGDDFTKNGSLIDYLNSFSSAKIVEDAKVSFMEYDWGLNGK